MGQPLDAPLRVEVCFVARHKLESVSWRLRFVADCVHTNHIIGLAHSSPSSFAPGKHIIELLAPGGVPSQGVPVTALSSLGVLETCLVDAEGSELGAARLVMDVRIASGGT